MNLDGSFVGAGDWCILSAGRKCEADGWWASCGGGYFEPQECTPVCRRKPVEKEKVEQLLRAGMAAPSGMDRRPWEFAVIDEREKLDKMADGLPYAKMLKGAPMAIVVCADERKSSYWYLDCSAAAQNILLAAEALELGAVWTATYPYEDRMKVVADVLGSPSYIKSLCVIPVGYPMGDYAPKDKWDATRIHYNTWK